MYPINLEIPLLRLHDVAEQLASNTVTFESQYCKTHCYDAPVMVQGVTEEPPEPVCSPDGLFEPPIRPQRPFPGNIVMFNGFFFFQTVKKGKLTIFSTSLNDMNKAIEAKDLKEWALQVIVPKQYHEFLPLFNNVLADHLQPHQPGVNHEVCLRDSETPMWDPLDSMLRTELAVLKEWLEQNMSKGLICQSSSPFAAPGHFAKKPDGGLQFCIDYRDLNRKTIKNRFPLPIIQDTVHLRRETKIYTKLTVHGAYNLLEEKELGEHELAFRTQYGLFEPTVMHFGIMNASADFQGYINNTVREALDDFASAYLDDVLIYCHGLGWE